MKRTRFWTTALVMTAVVAVAGCGGKSPEKAILGAWELDKEATQKFNPLLAAVPGGVAYEFREDGTGAEGIGGPGKPCTWKVVKKEGGKLTVEIARGEEQGEPSVIEVTVVDGDHIMVNYPKGLGACRLKRVVAGAARPAGGEATGDGAPTAGPRASIDPGLEDGVSAMAMAQDGKTVAVAGIGKEKSVKVFDLATLKEVKAFDSYREAVLPVALSPDGKVLAYARWHGGVNVRDVDTGKRRHDLRKKDGTFGFPVGLSFSPKGDLLVVGTNREILGWDAQSGEQRFAWPADEEEVTTLYFFPDGKRLASGGKDDKIKIWDVATGKIVQTLATGYKEKVLAIALSPDGKTLACSGFLEPIKVWNVETGTLHQTLERSNVPIRVDALLFLSDGKTLVFADRENNLNLVNVDTGVRQRVLKGHASYVKDLSKQVWALALTPDGRTLISGSDDGTFKLWDVK